MRSVTITVNGDRAPATVDPRTLLVHFLREELHLTGTHIGCDTANCGACTVLLDGEAVKSCTCSPSGRGREVTTIEGIAATASCIRCSTRSTSTRPPVRLLHPGHGDVGVKLLDENPHPTDAEIRLGLEGNLCRCTGYRTSSTRCGPRGRRVPA